MPLAYIKTISPRNATGDTAETYGYLAKVLGADDFAARIVQAFSLRPASMRRMVRSWELAMWTGTEPRASRELLASLISRLNECHY
jgi:alkylhydroperoxidase family enzyme